MQLRQQAAELQSPEPQQQLDNITTGFQPRQASYERPGAWHTPLPAARHLPPTPLSKVHLVIPFIGVFFLSTRIWDIRAVAVAFVENRFVVVGVVPVVVSVNGFFRGSMCVAWPTPSSQGRTGTIALSSPVRLQRRCARLSPVILAEQVYRTWPPRCGRAQACNASRPVASAQR